jgi:radical SAM family uncharacterized protein
MVSPAEIQSRLERILLKVQKPGRYVGGELNQVVKPWEQVQTHVALAFPEIYDIGQPNLGLAILYDQLNQRSDVLAERAYCPWPDMEAIMREINLPLYSLETKHALVNFDILGISLPYENIYTNALNMLDLAGIPIYAKERTKQHPLVIAGGHAAYNPEPMAAFIDAFVIGEGEEIIHEIVNIHQSWQAADTPRDDLLLKLSQVWGVYIPSLYTAQYNPDHTISSIEKMTPDAPLPVLKRITPTLPPPTTRFIVPSIDVVHNRIAVEIMRGCTRGCRFCHAGMVTRPVRERPVDEIIQAIQTGLEQTGYEEIALLSLSSSDYTHILELVEKLSLHFKDKHLTIALPSLRIESFSVDLLEQLKGSRPGGFTLAPEAANERMQRIINKHIPMEQLLDTAREIYSRGWTSIKLYFMIGHPSETLDDVKEIADLCKAVLAEGRKVIGNRASLRAGVSTFVPKPHTPFQWVACDTVEQITTKQNLLKKELRGRGLKLNWTDPEETMLEAWLSRGDRRMSGVIYSAWQNGAKFDAWQEHFNNQAWQNAFQNNGIDPDFYTHRQRGMDEIFPWEHISIGVHKSYLSKEYSRSQEGQLQPDCRDNCFTCGILPLFAEQRRDNPGPDWKCPEVPPVVSEDQPLNITASPGKQI